MKFTKRSRGDGSKTSFSLKAYEKIGGKILDSYGLEGYPSFLQKGDTFVLRVEDVDVAFVVNRAGESACTFCFPFRRPQVKRPVHKVVSLKARMY